MITTILLLALSLAMDCFAVSVTGGALVAKPKIKNALKDWGLFWAFPGFNAFNRLGAWLWI